LSFANTPLLIAPGRNNILIWLTGWSFDTFQVYHRWIARIVLAQATAHVIPYILYCALPGITSISPLIPGNDDRPGVYFRQWLRNYWIFGVLVTLVLESADSGILSTLVALRPFPSCLQATLLRILSHLPYRHGYHLLHRFIHPRVSSVKS
jgi:hypothetical protein